MVIEIPVKLLHEAEGHVVTIEMKTHEIYRLSCFKIYFF